MGNRWWLGCREILPSSVPKLSEISLSCQLLNSRYINAQLEEYISEQKNSWSEVKWSWQPMKVESKKWLTQPKTLTRVDYNTVAAKLRWLWWWWKWWQLEVWSEDWRLGIDDLGMMIRVKVLGIGLCEFWITDPGCEIGTWLGVLNLIWGYTDWNEGSGFLLRNRDERLG